MATTSSTTYDPVNTATALADAYVDSRQKLLDAQTASATATTAALTKLKAAFTAFETTMSSLSSKKSLLSNAASFSSAVGTAVAKPGAVAGTYSFYVEQLATAGQVSYGGITDTAAAGSGSLNVMLADGSNFNVNLTNADQDLNGTLTAKEIAAAINIEAGNDSRVTASTLTVNGTQTLVLSSTATGALNSVSINTAGVTNAGLKAQLDDPLQKKQLVVAQDAIIWLGAKTTGTKMQQASNSYTTVDDVTMTFSKAQAAGENPVTLSVAADTAGTAANVQAFVTAYNQLTATMDEVSRRADPLNKVAAGALNSDAGLSSLRSRMASTLRQVLGGTSLTVYGITGQRDGTLALDATRLNKSLALDPLALDQLFGSASSSAPSGVLGDLDELTSFWSDSSSGQLSQRRDSVERLQSSLTERQASLDSQYNSAYKRYLTQFTQLATLQTQMASNASLFDALFGAKDS